MVELREDKMSATEKKEEQLGFEYEEEGGEEGGEEFEEEDAKLEEMKRRVEEMEQEAAKLSKMQQQVKREMSTAADSIDEHSMYVRCFFFDLLRVVMKQAREYWMWTDIIETMMWLGDCGRGQLRGTGGLRSDACRTSGAFRSMRHDQPRDHYLR